jgi:hypothetical protein
MNKNQALGTESPGEMVDELMSGTTSEERAEQIIEEILSDDGPGDGDDETEGEGEEELTL